MGQIDDSQQPRTQHGERAGPALEVIAEDGQEPYVVRAKGQLDITNVAAFDRYLREAEMSDAQHILVDLDELSFMDSAALRTLLMASRRVRRGSRRLSVVATGGVRRIIELTGMASYLAIGEDG